MALQERDRAETFFSPETLKNPYDFYDRMRPREPVFKTALPGFQNEVFVVTSYALVKDTFDRPDDFSSEFQEVMMQGAEPHPEADALYLEGGGERQGSLLLNLDEPAHSRYRALVGTVFTPKLAAELTPKIEGIMDDLIDAVIERGECDFISEIAVPFPIYVISDLIGIDRALHKKMRVWSDAFLVRLSQQQTKAQDLQAVRHILEFQAHNRELIEARRREPKEDLVTRIVQARVGGMEPLTDREALILVQEISVAGNETTRNTLIGGMALLLKDPELWTRLRAQPDLVGNAVQEILRIFTPVAGMWRIAKRDTQLGGVDIPQGAIIMMRMEAANLDPVQFPNPWKIDVDRFNRNTHLTFGSGIHYCLGHILARRELTIAFARLIARLENPRVIAEKTDLNRPPSVLLRATNALHIAFDKGQKLSR